MQVATYVEIDFDDDTTLRFCEPSEVIEPDCIPALEGVSIAAAVLAPGETLGQRESVSVSMRDTQYPFQGTAFASGTLWGKVKARFPTLRGKALRVMQGDADEDIEDLPVRSYVIESFSVSKNAVTLQAKDFLKQLDGDRAQAPSGSVGRLLAGISDSDMALTLTPTGVGDEFYRAAGLATIGGREIVEYTRTGDAVTLVTRNMHGTEAVEHDADAAFQEVLEFNTGSGYEIDQTEFESTGLAVPGGVTFSGGLPAEILSYLMVKFAGVPAAAIPLTDWYIESTRAYSAVIPVPEAVSTLVNELIQQAGLVCWADSLQNVVRMRSLLNVSGTGEFDENRYQAGTYSADEQPSKQVTEAWVFWGRINPLKKIDERDNYKGAQLNIAADEYPAEFDDESAKSIRKVFGRWLHTQSNAEFLARLMLARYATPPRKITFGIHRADPGDVPELGSRCSVGHWSLQDEDGALSPVLAQVISIEPTWDQFKTIVEETSLRTAEGFTDRVVYLEDGSLDNNLRTLHDSQYATPESGDEVTFILPAGFVVGSSDFATPAVTVGDWPAGVTLRFVIYGRIAGSGGQGGFIFLSNSVAAEAGSTGLYTRYAITVRNEGVIAGGGGGGASGGSGAGGGGAGYEPGGAATFLGATPGTLLAGGTGSGASGDGGDPAEAGEAALSAGGAAGVAIDGEGFITYELEGSIVGARVN